MEGGARNTLAPVGNAPAFCERCGWENPAQSRYCNRCGERLVDPQGEQARAGGPAEPRCPRQGRPARGEPVPSSALAAPQLPATPEPGEHEPADAEAEPDVEGSAVVYNPVQPRHPVRVLWQSLFRQRVRVERPRNEAYLRSTPLFEDLTRRELRLLRGVVFQRTYGAGETVCAQGTPGAAMFIVRSGAVALTVEPPGGPPVHVLTLREGTFFGERALLEDEPRGFTARAEEETELLVLFRSDVERLIANHPHMGVRIFRKLGAILGVRLQMLREQLLPKAL